MNLIRALITVTGILVLGIGALSCDRMDKAMEAADKAKKLQSEIDRQAEQFKKKVEQSTENTQDRLKSETDTRDREEKNPQDENKPR